MDLPTANISADLATVLPDLNGHVTSQQQQPASIPERHSNDNDEINDKQRTAVVYTTGPGLVFSGRQHPQEMHGLPKGCVTVV